MTPFLFTLAFIAGLIIIDRNVGHFLELQLKRLGLAFEMFLFKLKMEYEIKMIWLNKRKYERMAKEILRDLGHEPD